MWQDSSTFTIWSSTQALLFNDLGRLSNADLVFTTVFLISWFILLRLCCVRMVLCCAPCSLQRSFTDFIHLWVIIRSMTVLFYNAIGRLSSTHSDFRAHVGCFEILNLGLTSEGRVRHDRGLLFHIRWPRLLLVICLIRFIVRIGTWHFGSTLHVTRGHLTRFRLSQHWF